MSAATEAAAGAAPPNSNVTATDAAPDDIFTIGDVIRVPLAGGVQYVEVKLNELPDDLEQVQKLLQYEYVPLKYWIQFAVAYYRRKKYDQFETLLKVASSEDTIQALQESTDVKPRERIRIQTMLAAYKIKQAANPTLDATQRADCFAAADAHLRAADQIENINPGIHSLSIACKGFLTFMRNAAVHSLKSNSSSANFAFALASEQFNGALSSMPSSESFLHAELGRAALLFRQKKYEQAEAAYRDIIRRVPSCPASVRVALGYCFERLGKHSLALKAMQRAVDLEPQNEEALVALAIFGRQARHLPKGTLSKTPKELRRKYKELLVTANVASAQRCEGSGGIELRNPQCLNHLARYIATEWQSEGGIIKGIMSLKSGSSVAHASMDLRNTLRKGQLVRIGRYCFIVDPKREVTESEVPLNRPHDGPSQSDLVLEYPKLKESQEFAQMALESTTTAEIKAEAEYYIGRCFHASGDLAKAKEHYHEAMELAGKQTRRAADGSIVKLGPMALALFSLAQISITEGNFHKALKRLQRVHIDYPDVPEVMLRIGYLHLLLGQPQEALPMFKRTTQLQANYRNRNGRLIALIMTAEILQSDPRKINQVEALDYYKQAIAFRQKDIDALGETSAGAADSSEAAPVFVSPELLANAGALYHDLGHLKEAKELYQKCLRACDLFGEVYDGCRTVRVTTRYNFARLLEDEGNTNEAEAAYEKLLNDHPNYVDGWLRLAIIRGNTGDADAKRELLLKAQKLCEAWPELLGVGVQSSFAVSGTNATVMLGDEAFRERKLADAAEYYSKVSRFRISGETLKAVKSAVNAAAPSNHAILGRHKRELDSRAVAVSRKLQRDPYVGTRRANILWERKKAADAKQEQHKAQQYLMRYEDELKKCLSLDSGNLFAANGLALALVEKDELDAAQNLLRRVREGSERTDRNPCPSAFINLAHVHMLKQNYNDAKVEYERVLARFAPGGTQVLLNNEEHAELLVYTASACNELAEFGTGIKYIEKALELTPDDLRLVALHAVSHQKWARHVLLQAQNDLADVTVEQLEGSLESVKIAKTKFNWLDGHERTAAALPKVLVNNLAANAKWCADTEGVAGDYITAAKNHAAERARVRQEAEEAKKQREEAERAEARAREEAKRAADENLKKLLAQRRAQAAAEREAQRAAKEAEEEEEKELNIDSLPSNPAAKRRKPRKRTVTKRKKPTQRSTTKRSRKRREVDSSDDSSDDEPSSTRRTRTVVSSDDDSDSDAEPTAEAKKRALARMRSDSPQPASKPVRSRTKTSRTIDSDSDSDSDDDAQPAARVRKPPATKPRARPQKPRARAKKPSNLSLADLDFGSSDSGDEDYFDEKAKADKPASPTPKETAAEDSDDDEEVVDQSAAPSKDLFE